MLTVLPGNNDEANNSELVTVKFKNEEQDNAYIGTQKQVNLSKLTCPTCRMCFHGRYKTIFYWCYNRPRRLDHESHSN